MNRLIPIFMTLTLLGLAAMSGGCAVYDVAVEERNAGDWANDKGISMSIEQKFLADDSVKYLDYDAYSYEGHVYIIGEYESRSQVDRAVEIAKSVKDVRTVTTYMLPKRASDHCGTTDNMGIYTSVKSKLVGDGDIWSTNVDIETIQCHVVLLGIVGSKKEITKAIAHAKSVDGVRKVKSYLKVK